jgi:hypothetical protein
MISQEKGRKPYPKWGHLPNKFRIGGLDAPAGKVSVLIQYTLTPKERRFQTKLGCTRASLVGTDAPLGLAWLLHKRQNFPPGASSRIHPF